MRAMPLMYKSTAQPKALVKGIIFEILKGFLRTLIELNVQYLKVKVIKLNLRTITG